MERKHHQNVYNEQLSHHQNFIKTSLKSDRLKNPSKCKYVTCSLETQNHRHNSSAIRLLSARCRSSLSHSEKTTCEVHENSCRNWAWSCQTSFKENSEQTADAGISQERSGSHWSWYNRVAFAGVTLFHCRNSFIQRLEKRTQWDIP